MPNYTGMDDVFDALDDVIEAAKKADLYMPAVVTAFRLRADELSEIFPSETNG